MRERKRVIPGHERKEESYTWTCGHNRKKRAIPGHDRKEESYTWT
jgi:hypothetical protein